MPRASIRSSAPISANRKAVRPGDRRTDPKRRQESNQPASMAVSGRLFVRSQASGCADDQSPSTPCSQVQTGEVTSRGIELEAVANVTPELKVTGLVHQFPLFVSKDLNPLLIDTGSNQHANHNSHRLWADYTFKTGTADRLWLWRRRSLQRRFLCWYQTNFAGRSGLCRRRRFRRTMSTRTGASSSTSPTSPTIFMSEAVQRRQHAFTQIDAARWQAWLTNGRALPALRPGGDAVKASSGFGRRSINGPALYLLSSC